MLEWNEGAAMENRWCLEPWLSALRAVSRLGWKRHGDKFWRACPARGGIGRAQQRRHGHLGSGASGRYSLAKVGGRLVAKSCPTLQPHGLQNARLPCLSVSPGVCSSSCPLSQWCHPVILSSVIPFSSCPRSFPASESFPVSQFFISGGQSIRTSASALVLPMNFQSWFSLGFIGFISLLSRGLSRVFSSSTVQKDQLFSTQPSL